jgi:hypothetical protein
LGEVEFVSKDALVNGCYFDEVKEIEDYLSVVSGVVYCALGLRVTLRFRSWLFSSTSNTDYPTYAWLRNIALLMGLLIALLASGVTLDYFFSLGNVFLHWQVFFVYMAELFYYLGFRGYQLPDRPFPVVDAATENPAPLPQTVETVAPAQSKFDLSAEKLAALKDEITHALELKQGYLDSDLNIQKLASIVQASPTLVSAVVNQAFHQKFFVTLWNSNLKARAFVLFAFYFYRAI